MTPKSSANMDPRRKTLERKTLENLQKNCVGGKEGSLDSKADWILVYVL